MMTPLETAMAVALAAEAKNLEQRMINAAHALLGRNACPLCEDRIRRCAELEKQVAELKSQIDRSK